MHNFNQIRAAFFLTFLLSLSSELLGTWVRNHKEAVINTNISLLQARQYYLDDTSKIVTPLFRETVLNLYGEYGITGYWTTGLYVPLKFLQSASSLNNDSINEDLFALGDINAIQKFQFLQSAGFLFSFLLETGLPIGKSTLGAGETLLTGYGQASIMPKFAVAYGIQRLYMDVHIGFNKRFGEFSDEIHWGVLLGISLVPKMIKFEIDVKSQHSLRNKSGRGITSLLFANNIEFYSYRFNLIYTFKKNMGINLDVKSAAIIANFYASLVYSLGYYVIF